VAIASASPQLKIVSEQGGAFMDASSEKLRLVLAKFDNVADESALLQEDIVVEARETIRRHLLDNQTIIRDLQDKLRRSQEDAELQAQRSDDLQDLLEQRDAAYEELFAEGVCQWQQLVIKGTDDNHCSRTIL
jgi:hypothetical protein